MSRALRGLVLLTFVLALAAGLAAVAQARAVATASKPAFSQAPVAGIPFTASGVVRPRATAMSRTAVMVRLYTRAGGHWSVTGGYRAKLAAGTSRHEVLRRGSPLPRRAGTPSGRSTTARAGSSRRPRWPRSTWSRRITIDSNVNGWMAPSLGQTQAPPGTPLDVVFTTPSDWAAPLVDGKPLNGAAEFIWGEFEQVDEDGLDLAHGRLGAGSV